LCTDSCGLTRSLRASNRGRTGTGLTRVGATRAQSAGPAADACATVGRSALPFPPELGPDRTWATATGRSGPACLRHEPLPPGLQRLPRRPIPRRDLTDRGAPEHLGHRR
jgi:hypothetical protein